MNKLLITAATLIACSFITTSNAAEWNKIEGAQLGSSKLTSQWACQPQSKMGAILGITTCTLNTKTVMGMTVNGVEAGLYDEHAGKLGMIYIHLNPSQTSDFGKLLNKELGKPSKLTQMTPESFTMTWRRKGYEVKMQRDDKRGSASITIIANWAAN